MAAVGLFEPAVGSVIYVNMSQPLALNLTRHHYLIRTSTNNFSISVSPQLQLLLFNILTLDSLYTLTYAKATKLKQLQDEFSSQDSSIGDHDGVLYLNRGRSCTFYAALIVHVLVRCAISV